jgi:hypothetical protein
MDAACKTAKRYFEFFAADHFTQRYRPAKQHPRDRPEQDACENDDGVLTTAANDG